MAKVEAPRPFPRNHAPVKGAPGETRHVNVAGSGFQSGQRLPFIAAGDFTVAGRPAKRAGFARVTMLALALTLASNQRALSVTLEYPHADVHNIGCSACHDSPGSIPAGYGPYTSWNSDDTPANNLCLSCHNDIEAPFVRTHSSLTTSGRYGAWSIECRTCHEPHEQLQAKTYGPESYVYSGQAIEVGSSTIREPGAGWTPDEWVGWLVLGNVAYSGLSYGILANTTDTLTVEGTLNPAVTPGSTFAIFYGKLVRATITTPNSGAKTVKFFDATGAHSFADGDATYDGVCEVCHTQTAHYRNDGSGPDQHHADVGGADGLRCVGCHSHQSGFAHGGGAGAGGLGCGTATSCHGTQESHPTHVSGLQLSLDCSECHDTAGFPRFIDGQDKAGTHVCDTCHSTNGTGLAKQYWDYPGSSLQAPGSWAAVEGERSFCGSCHDFTPGNTKADGTGDTAPNILGDDSTYGFYATGHGKESGYYARMSWQDTAATGNPAGVTSCGSCHDPTLTHFGSTDKRLRAGFENDQANTNCRHCHSWDASEGTVAVSPPHFYTTSAAYEASAHGAELCTDCHDVHAATGSYAGMTRANNENLCYQCHKDPAQGGVENDALSGPGLADDVQQALAMPYKHDLGASFTRDGNTYTLQCTTCHNVHIVTGKYWDADQTKSPLTRVSNNTSLWGASPGQKIADYAAAGTYQAPNGDPFGGDVLPDYVTFCTDCHNDSNVIYSVSLARDLRTFDWQDDKHGRLGAQHSNTSLLPPYGGGLLGTYVLSCTDCHEAHGSTNNYALRTRVNDGEVTVTGFGYGDGGAGREWDSLCSKCHTGISDFHHWYYRNTATACSDCHFAHGTPYRNCADCHSHPGITPAPTFTPTPTVSTTATPVM